MPVDLLVRPRDPMLFGDGRPFTADPGARAVTLSWPWPGTCAGAVRTAVGNASGFNWQTDLGRALEIAVSGPLAAVKETPGAPHEVYLPCPLDAVPYEQDGSPRVMRLRPRSAPAGGGCNLPHGSLLPLAVTGEVKPAAGREWWSLPDAVRWLGNPRGSAPAERTMGSLPKEVRTHVRISPSSGTAVPGFLFGTVSLRFPDGSSRSRDEGPSEVAILVRVEPGAGEVVPASGFLPLGGERRLALLESGAGLWPAPDQALVGAIAGSKRLSLCLATPALFAGGWLPGWLDGDLEGTPPDAGGLRLRLVSAAVGRRIGVSGWDMATRSPKPARAAVPAGSVYFFEVLGCEPLSEEVVRSLWLRPVSDGEQERRDGFGLALPGTWIPAEEVKS